MFRTTPLARVRPSRCTPAACLPLAALVLLGACGDDRDGFPESVEITATDYAFAGLPETIGTDTELTMRNDSTGEVHELVAFRLPDHIEGTASEILALPEEQLATFLDGPPALVIVAGPGDEPMLAAGDGRLAESGRYLLFCAIPTGADPAAFMAAAATSDGPPDVAGGPPHFVHGMAATVEVVDSSGSVPGGSADR